MTDTNVLVDQLAGLPDGDWFAVLEQANKRRQVLRKVPDEPRPGISKLEFAEWIAHCHFATDTTIRDVIYLPEEAPPTEIRLLEVNTLWTVPDSEPIEPNDFSPEIDGIDYRVLAADVSPQQWSKIQAGQMALPRGWQIRGFKRLGVNESADT